MRFRRERSEVNIVVKYLLFGVNTIIWIIGIILLGIGVWAYIEKNNLNNLSALTNKIFDPVLLLLIAGSVIFVVGFFGCIGALRENIILLTLYSILLTIILLLIIIGAIIVFAFKDWLESRILESGVKDFIKNYRDDLDFKDLVDWVQADWLHCCGLKDKDDWENNRYFNCSSPSIDACGVPYSCCKPENNGLLNLQCGNEARDKKQFTNTRIYNEGCLSAGKKWFNDQIIAIAGIIVAVCVILMIGICCSWNLRADIKAQISKWERV